MCFIDETNHAGSHFKTNRVVEASRRGRGSLHRYANLLARRGLPASLPGLQESRNPVF